MQESVTAPIITPTLVGRAGQLAALQLLIEHTKQGRGHVALISGEAGIGKSRLVAEAKGLGATRNFLPLQGNCFPTDLSYPYAPLLDLLRTLAASNPSAALEALARNIFPLLPELVANQTMPLPLLEPEQEKRRLFAVLTKFFLDLSTRTPILLVVEDVHWSDETSLDFLHYLARSSVAHPILLLITYRHDEVRAELRSWLAQLDRGRLAQEIRLMPLARDEVNAMLSAIFDARHTAFDMRRFLHGELLDALYALTEGNPFFVEEALSALMAVGDIFYVQGYWNRKAGSEVHIPRNVQDGVQRRTARLSEGARYVLTLAAVAGRRFDFALLQQLTRFDEQQLLPLMKELVAAQLVVEESDDQFAFKHALTRQAIYAQLLTRERSTLHRTIADTLEQQSTAALDMHLEELANHFYCAHVWQKAADYARRAGEKALRLYAHRAAINYFTWGLEAAQHLAHPPLPTLYRARGQAYEMLGEFEQARSDYTSALDRARTLQDRTAEWQSTIDLGFLAAGRDYAQAETFFREALDLAQHLDDPALHAYSLNRIGNWHLNVEQPHEALHYHREALATFERLHHTRGIAETLDLLGMVSYLDGDLLQGTAYYRQAIALFRELEDRSGLTSSLATLALRGPTYQTDGLVAAASLAEASQDAEDALVIAREIGQRAAEAYALFQLGLCLGSRGEYGRALAMARQSLDIAREIEHREWQTAAHTVLGGMYSGMLAYEQACEHFEQALALAQEIGSLFWTRIATGYLASAALQLHDLDRAEQLLHGVLNPAVLAQTMAQRLIWCASVELLLAQGEPSRALAASDAQVMQGESVRVLKLRGDALLALLRFDEAEGALREAQELAAVQGVRPLQWRICIALGKLYQLQGKSAESERTWALARTLLEELADTIEDEALREHFLQQAGALFPQNRPLSPARSAKLALRGLTARECEVATLIAQGKSNQAIAAALVVSKRTVETHIGNIMFKLDCTSRTQIAVWAVEMGLSGQGRTRVYVDELGQ